MTRIILYLIDLTRTVDIVVPWTINLSLERARRRKITGMIEIAVIKIIFTIRRAMIIIV